MSGTRILAGVLGLWTLLRATNADSSGRTLIDHLIGNKASKSPILAATAAGAADPASPASANPGAGSVLRELFPAGTHVTLKRHDQGRDLQAPPNTSVLAPGSGYLVRNGSDPGGFGTAYPIVHFTSGPWAGEDIYIGHTLSLLFNPGAKFYAGQPIAKTQNGRGPYVGNAAGLPGWAEIGLAPAGNPGAMGQPVPAGL